MRRLTWVVLVLLVVPAPLLFVLSREAWAVDRCLDRGGSFDYETMSCDHGRGHPYVPFRERHGRLVSVTAVAVFLGLVAVLVVPLKGRDRGR